MRGKKAFVNTVFSVLEEIVAFLSAFILPRLILSVFGSKYNGLITAITQFLAYAELLRSGIGGVTRAALYKPLAEGNREKISRIVRASDIFMKRVGCILAGSILVFAVICPILVKNEFDWFFTFSLVLIIGVSKFAESFFGITYYTVLQADQRLWVASLMKIVCYTANTAIGAVMILQGASIHAVKLVSTVIYVIYPIVLNSYVSHFYHIDKKVVPDMSAISQRWDAFWQEMAVFVMNNTDVMVLTVFSNLLEVSVYSVYNMVVHGLKRSIYSVSNGLEAAFGNMIAKKEAEALRENVTVIENLMFSLSTIVYTSAAMLILSFVKLYTNHITDADYIRPAFAYIIILAQFCSSVRLPYQLVTQASGHYKQTKKGAIIEPIINISLSILLVIRYGLVGVAVGTLVAIIFRTTQYSHYMRKHIISRPWYITPLRFLVSFCESALCMLAVHLLSLKEPTHYLEWALNAVMITALCGFIVILCNSFIFHKDSVNTVRKIKAVLHKRS